MTHENEQRVIAADDLGEGRGGAAAGDNRKRVQIESGKGQRRKRISERGRVGGRGGGGVHVVTSVKRIVITEWAGTASALAESRDSSGATRCFLKRGFVAEGTASVGSAS
jgi:hypothetical protein